VRKKLLLIVIVSIVAVSGVVAGVLLHQGDEPSNGGSPEPPTTSPTLTILSITKGNVSVRKAGASSWIAAQVGMPLAIGDSVKSGNSSGADITFFDGSTIELEADTELEVVSLGISSAGSTTIRLKQAIGTTISRVNKLVDSASRYEVETPACVAVVRGSIMTINVIADGTTWVTNNRGDIWVIANGAELQIPQGRKCIVTPGEPPQLAPTSRGSETGGGRRGFSPNPDIEITKTANPTQAHDEDLVTYTYVVTNPGNVLLSNVSVTDNMIEQVTYQSGDTNQNGLLDMSETWIFSANYTVTTEDDSPLVNTAAAAGTYAGAGTIIAWDAASVDILRPAIAMNKTGQLWEDWEHEALCINYTYTVTNPGNTPLFDVSVVDAMTGEPLHQSGDTNGNSRLDTGETWIFAATYEIPYGYYGESVTNNATAYGTDALGETITAEASCTISIIVTETASISVQIDMGPQAPIFIWDDNTGSWAIDQDTEQPVDGTNHTTPDSIVVVGGHCYYVWVHTGEEWYDVSAWPDGWDVISYIDFLELEVAAVYGCTAADSLYPVNFTVYY